MKIRKSIDIEREIRDALMDYLTVYCRPLPAEYDLPHILVTQVGGMVSQTIDTFFVVLDSRAETEARAMNYLSTAIGILEQVTKEQTTALRHLVVNSSGSWGIDPVRPDLAMCSARLEIVAHQVVEEIEPGQGETVIVDHERALIIAMEE